MMIKLIKLIKQWFEEREQKRLLKKFYVIRVDVAEEYRRKIDERSE